MRCRNCNTVHINPNHPNTHMVMVMDHPSCTPDYLVSRRRCTINSMSQQPGAPGQQPYGVQGQQPYGFQGQQPYGVAPQQPGPPMKESYTYDTFACFDDMSACLYVSFCGLCAICKIAEGIGAEETHGSAGVCKMLCATSCPLCALCCCMESIQPCFLSSLLKKSMAKHNIKSYPTPCGDTGCCGCLFQMYCCGSCTLCVMLRELQLSQGAAGNTA